MISPDRTRVAAVKFDPESETRDLWVFDIATGKSTRITSSQKREGAISPVWSPDGTQLAYVALHEGYWGVYRRASNAKGAEELLYRHSGANLRLLDWSLDGRFLGFSATDLSGGILYALPLAGDGQRKPIQIFGSQSQVWGSNFAPDNNYE